MYFTPHRTPIINMNGGANIERYVVLSCQYNKPRSFLPSLTVDHKFCLKTKMCVFMYQETIKCRYCGKHPNKTAINTQVWRYLS